MFINHIFKKIIYLQFLAILISFLTPSSLSSFPYRLTKTDNFAKLSKRFSYSLHTITVEELRRANKKHREFGPGIIVEIPFPNKNLIKHRIRRGDTIVMLSNKYYLKVKVIKKWLGNRKLMLGKTLYLPKSTPFRNNQRKPTINSGTEKLTSTVTNTKEHATIANKYQSPPYLTEAKRNRNDSQNENGIQFLYMNKMPNPSGVKKYANNIVLDHNIIHLTPLEAIKEANLQFIQPNNNPLIKPYGLHEKVFFAGQLHQLKANYTIHAIEKGRVVFVGDFRGVGNVVIIDHSNDFHSMYEVKGNGSKKVGDSIAKGEIIASSIPTSQDDSSNEIFIRTKKKLFDTIREYKKSNLVISKDNPTTSAEEQSFDTFYFAVYYRGVPIDPKIIFNNKNFSEKSQVYAKEKSSHRNTQAN